MEPKASEGTCHEQVCTGLCVLTCHSSWSRLRHRREQTSLQPKAPGQVQKGPQESVQCLFVLGESQFRSDEDRLGPFPSEA